MKILIQNKKEYQAAKARGLEPLTDFLFFEMEIRLRVSLQFELFGESETLRGSVVKANQRYYKWCWNNSFMVCENCMTPLFSNRNIDNTYNATYISHILSRSNKPEMAHDPRNKNILCAKCHKKWESLKNVEMLIYPENKKIIGILNNEYKNLIQ